MTMADRTDVERGRCEECRVPMVSKHAYCRDRLIWKRRGYARYGGFGFCSACYLRRGRHGTLPTRATVVIAATYTITCSGCGDVGTATTNAAAVQLCKEHRETHATPYSPPKPPLSDAELARLRTAVGIGGAA